MPLISAASYEITILAAGDIYLGGSANAYLDEHGFEYPFAQIKDILKESDMEKEFILKPDPAAIAALKSAGFNAVTLANNPILWITG